MFWVLFLVPAWAVAGTACARLCVAATRAADSPAAEQRAAARHELTLYEAAFLAGGPRRVADLALVSMADAGRLLLAHTGWATVVDPDGRDEMERSVIGAIGPEGQQRIAPVRASAAATVPVRALAERLTAAGLAVPAAARLHVTVAIRQVRAAALAVLALAVASLVLLPPGTDGVLPVLAWFALPLALTLGSLVIARAEIQPYTRWASPAGRRLLGALGPALDERDPLAAVAVRGVDALSDPRLRAAFAHGRTRQGQ
ncbi:TIGR04222 domain-containing membrane protein [Streptomyces cavernicola]|uniref:TIGR04222 domain-containing membrane protein n=1 Tax=Streptomyces cavernicola TaxID=3043613 RepID=A0ABT6S354_9ACTN|nr:TIGR04222 domain-containing membrane protein [Streptomyces sp. B-S-A6]MDI3402324.1 TIGR04222 domain-containing membrane protein [Streptomyces sp. B-S-A6]